MIKKKVLLVTPYFPPINQIASKRWGYMIKYLIDDFDIKIFTTHGEGDLEIPILETEIIRVGITNNNVFKNQNIKKSNLRRLIFKFSKNLRLIDSTIVDFFLKHKSELLETVESFKPDIIITSVGPIGGAYMGYVVKKNYQNIKWLVDLRDSLSILNHSEKKWYEKLVDEKLDKYIFKMADSFITVSNYLASEMRKFYGKEVNVIYNGFDGELINSISKDNTEKKQLYYAGYIYPHREKAMYTLFNSIQNQNVVFKMRLLSDSDQLHKYLEYIRANQLNNIEILPPTEYQNVLEEESMSDILVLFEDMSKENNISIGTLTGKLFEYLQFNKPILAICREDSEIGDVLNETNSGKICTSEVEIIKFIEAGELNFNDKKKVIYSRRNQANLVSIILNNL